MSSTIITILSIFAFSIAVLVLYYILKPYLLKLKINKWVLLGVAVAIFFVPLIIWPSMPRAVANYVIPGIFVFLVLWFMDMSGFMRRKNTSTSNYDSGKSKKNDVVIRPKAKPNRVKKNIDERK